jgi:hypothetical protein
VLLPAIAGQHGAIAPARSAPSGPRTTNSTIQLRLVDAAAIGEDEFTGLIRAAQAP